MALLTPHWGLVRDGIGSDGSTPKGLQSMRFLRSDRACEQDRARAQGFPTPLFRERERQAVELGLWPTAAARLPAGRLCAATAAWLSDEPLRLAVIDGIAE
jgi:hypothetical protein